MININLQNVEELIFFNNEIQTILPDFLPLFQQWKSAIRASYLRSLRKNLCLELLNNLNTEHIKNLKEYFKEDVCISKINHRIVRNYKISLFDNINELEFKNIAISRDADNIYITSWM